MSSELVQKLDEILKNHPLADRHSYFQLKNYIIGKEHTLHGKMWQCVREIKSRRDSIDSIKLQIEDVNDKLELIDIQKEKLEIPNTSYEIPGEHAGLWEREKAIKLRQLNRDKAQLEKNGHDLVEKMKNIQEEAAFFANAFDALKNMGNWKDYDDEQAQLHYWNAKLEHELNMRLVLGMPVDMELGKTIESLEDQTPVKQKLMGIIQERQKLAHQQKAALEKKNG